MANKVTMNICGQEYTLVADESAAYMEKVGALVDERMRQVLDALLVSQTDAAVLAAVNLADELLKNQAAAEKPGGLGKAKGGGGPYWVPPPPLQTGSPLRLYRKRDALFQGALPPRGYAAKGLRRQEAVPPRAFIA